MSSPTIESDPAVYAPDGSAPPTPPPAPRASLPGRVVRGVALLVVFGLALEAACRVEDWVRYRTPILSRIRSQEDLLVHDADGAHGRANASYLKWHMNALGMRGPDATVAKPAGTFRVVTAGASETFGLYESPEAEYPRQLEDSLRAAVAACGTAAPRFEVLNAALPGMSLPTITQDVRNRLRRYSVDAVVLYPSPVGFLDFEPPRAARPDSSSRAGALPLRHALAPRAVTRVRNQLKLLIPDVVQTWLRERQTARLLASHPADWRFTAPPADRLALYEQGLRGAVGAVRAIGARPVLATHANMFMRPGPPNRDMLVAWEKFYPRASGPVIVAFDSLAREATLRVARDSNVTVVDVAQRLAHASGDTFADFVHFTDRGAAEAAAVMVPGVLTAARDAGLLPACAPPAS